MSARINADATHVCDVWKKDSGINCTPLEFGAVVRVMERTYPAMQRGGQKSMRALQEYQRGIIDIFGRMPRDPEIAAHNRAVGVVSDYCDTQPPRCTDRQRTALINLLREEYLRPEPLDEVEAATRRAGLNENIRRILRTRDPVVPPPRR